METSTIPRSPRIEAVKQILESAEFNHAVHVNKLQIFDAWSKTSPDMLDEREDLYMALQAMDAVRMRMLRIYGAAKAEEDIEAYRRELDG